MGACPAVAVSDGRSKRWSGTSGVDLLVVRANASKHDSRAGVTPASRTLAHILRACPYARLKDFFQLKLCSLTLTISRPPHSSPLLRSRFFAPQTAANTKQKGGYGTCVEASWHGSRVAVKQLLAPNRGRSALGGASFGGGGGGSGWKTGGTPTGGVVSAAASAAMRREIRLLQALRFEFLVPIYGVSEEEEEEGALHGHLTADVPSYMYPIAHPHPKMYITKLV